MTRELDAAIAWCDAAGFDHSKESLVWMRFAIRTFKIDPALSLAATMYVAALTLPARPARGS